MVAPVNHILPVALIRRQRNLPLPGKVLVRMGQKVNATDPVAEAQLPGQHALFNIRRLLGGGRSSDKADRFIEVKVGARVMKGDVIAEAGGLLPHIVRAPANGQVVAIVSGQVLIEMEPQLVQVYAGLNGTVTEVAPELGCTIEASGALIQGVWGNGKVGLGLLLALAKEPLDEVTRASLDVSMRGAVVLGGYCCKEDAIEAGNELPLRGLILGSMSADLVPAALAARFPIILTEGFGPIPMNSAAFKLFSTSERRDLCVNAVSDPVKGDRPEVVIPLPATGQLPMELVSFKPGQLVHIWGPPHAGKIGTLLQVRPGLSALPNGVRTAAADVRLENNEPVVVPLANLDVIE
ncbi:MAG TPA: hypothetical protein PKG95_07640 [Anaerolineaceae bacterium]|nr:hypothetical protein [Anaerolineaceae bacterium]